MSRDVLLLPLDYPFTRKVECPKCLLPAAEYGMVRHTHADEAMTEMVSRHQVQTTYCTHCGHAER